MPKYKPREIEKKWQERWLEDNVFKASEDSKKQKYYQLETFPYPSAAGLHVGHPKGYIAEDIHARYMRMNGREVLYTMGWDAFGLPTENYAIKVGKSPKEVAVGNIKNFKRQVQMFGLSYDWDREINTSSPEYYKWTQWLFIQLFNKGLAYRAKAKVNWCPKDQTVLANEQVIDGKCERDGEEVAQREMEQWFFKITDYAERLLEDMEGLDWPESTVKRQKDWIGRSEGALIEFRIQNSESRIEVFTTRPDTLFGATYMVLAPENPLVKNLESRIENLEEVEGYIEQAKKKTELMRQEGDPSMSSGQGKTGVELKGVRAINPATKEEIPIWIADYVLMGYGTGAIMAVPAHDERDFEFAKKFKLPIKKVISPVLRPASRVDGAVGISGSEIVVESECWEGDGVLVNSDKFDGLDSKKAKWKITKSVGGKKKVQYKIRDWSVSRQRYWGVPIPMLHCAACGVVPVPEKDLPIVLPDLENYRPKGVPPLAGSKEFISAKCPKCGGAAGRDPETLDTFVDSSWYYLRYADPQNDKEIFDKKKANHWLPVDLYVIGAEHAVLHLLYSRFITKFLHDEGLLKFKEPFSKLRHQGLILGEDGQKMSKSKGNVVNPDELIEEFGADTVRLYEMFMGPFEAGQPWDSKGVLGVHRFLNRFWEYVSSVTESPDYKNLKTSAEGDVIVHTAVKKVGGDIESLKFNTAISALMILMNDLMSQGIKLGSGDIGVIIKLLHPFAPHMAQELWDRVGNKTFVDFEEWPEYDQKLIEKDTFMLVVQVNGKVRDNVDAESDISEQEAIELALGRERIKKFIGSGKPKKIVYVPNRLINIVI